MATESTRWNGWWARRVRQRALALWRSAPAVLPQLTTGAQARLLAEAQQLQDALTRVHAARPQRLAAPVVLPLQADWGTRAPVFTAPAPHPRCVRPETGYELASGVRLYHDCALAEIILTQSLQSDGLVPFAVALETLAFEGSFLSLVFEFPPEAAQGLRVRHVVAARPRLWAERDMRVFARLNIRHGPNTEQQVNQFDLSAGQWHDPTIEFDLAYTRIAEKRVESLWLDLIVEKPAMCRLVIGDLVLSRRPRAEI